MRSQDELFRSANRARINDIANGSPPLTELEAAENNANTNVNFLEFTSLVHKARSTWNNALLKPGNFFKVSLDCGPIHKRSAYGNKITANINRPMKRSRRYTETIRGTGASVVLHGPGPVWWPKPQHWTPEEIGIEDLLVPDNTRVNLENLSHFAIYHQFTPGQLFRMTHGKRVDPGWNMKAVRAELRRVTSELAISTQSNQGLMNPEKLAEYYKANGGIYDSDRVPTIDCWAFFHQNDDEEDGRWYKKIIMDAPAVTSGEFLYNPKRPFASNLSQILHIQFGDGANVSPFRYHSVRSLGFLLYAVCHLQNRLRCRFMDAIFEATLMYFRNVSEGDRARLEKVDLTHMGIIPEGLTMVPRADRWEINENLVVAGLSQNRQLMSENASAFVQDVDNGTAKELTATEVMARLNSANALVSSLLSMAYTYQEFQYREIARRFCIKDSPDPDVKRFREDCIKDGVPIEYLNSEYWIIEVERVMGGGNKTLEIAQAKSLMEIKPQLDPPAQRDVLRSYVLAITDDADMAFRLVPETTSRDNPSAHDAEVAMGSILAGAPVRVRKSIDQISYVEAFLSSMLAVTEDIKHLQGAGEEPTGQNVIGMTNAYRHVMGHVMIIAQDPAERQRVKSYNDVLGNIMNQVKAWGQLADQAREKEAQAQNQESQAKAQATMLQAQVKAAVMKETAALKAQIKQLEFQADQQRKNAKAAQELQVGALKAAADIEATDAKTAATVRAKKQTAAATAKSKDE